ncbi:MAG: S1C family serine protease [Actinomycetota bacterium]|nr:S1C family serine protease [Actinomycetota bacterium]
MDTRPDAPDPSEDGEARQEPTEGVGTDWVMEEEGPFFAWLPPEDRLWRHPSEGQSAGPVLELARSRSDARRWADWVRPLRGTWAVALVAGLIGATAATGIGVAGGLWPHQTTVFRSSQPATSSVSLSALGSGSTNWTAIDDSVALSVVTISVDGVSGPEVGSGLVFSQSSNGYTYIVTDRALFARGLAIGYYGQVRVTYATGESAGAQLIGADALSGLAVLKAPSPPSGNTVPASLGSVASLSDADAVLAVGSRAAPSVSPGLVSAQDRTVSLSDGSDMDGLMAVSMTSLSPTAAGGPLLDQFGQVVGLTLSLEPVSQSDQALTFAAPIDEVTRVASAYVNGTPVTHPWIGITDAMDAPSEMAHQMGIFGGVLAGGVASPGPARAAGIRPYDIITSLDGKATSSTGALVAELSECSPGHPVPVTYVHSGHTVRTMVTIGNEPSDS